MTSASSPLAVVLTTVESVEQARTLAHALVERRLAACVSIIDVAASIYRWEGKIVDSPEKMLVIKTRPDALDSLKSAISELHPYTVPEIVVLAGEASEAYGNWVVAEVLGKAPGGSRR